MGITPEQAERINNGELIVLGPNRFGITERGMEVERAELRKELFERQRREWPVIRFFRTLFARY